MNDVYKVQDKSWQNSSQALNVEFNDLTGKQSEEESDDAPIGLDPILSSYLCPSCGASCLDLGKQDPEVAEKIESGEIAWQATLTGDFRGRAVA